MIDSLEKTAELQAQLSHYNHLYLGLSGGLDSTVLLHMLASIPALKSKLTAIHINHGISPNADAWERHCQQYCESLGISFSAIQIRLDSRRNLEEAARTARYQALLSFIQKNDCLLTGHHQDDQAETLLLHLFRGTGIDGLAAMAAVSNLGQGDLVRPFLSISRQCLEVYAVKKELSWLEDESNDDPNFSRNFLRRIIFPLLQKKWPGVTANLDRTSRHCRQAQSNLKDLAEIDCPALLETKTELSLKPLLHLSAARLSNVLRTWLRNNNVRLPAEMTVNRLLSELIMAEENANPKVEWDGISIRRYQQQLYLLPNQPKSLNLNQSWTFFPNSLILPDKQGILTAEPVLAGVFIQPDDVVELRFRQGGESMIWHGQTKALKKLMQEWQIPPWLRQDLPLIYINEQLAVVVGYAISDRFYAEHKDHVFNIGFNPVLESVDS